jgi:hypothetical protein
MDRGYLFRWGRSDEGVVGFQTLDDGAELASKHGIFEIEQGPEARPDPGAHTCRQGSTRTLAGDSWNLQKVLSSICNLLVMVRGPMRSPRCPARSARAEMLHARLADRFFAGLMYGVSNIATECQRRRMQVGYRRRGLRV